jgi:prepilin-type N-terminal cleavage/methylation domain-containing protein/prepilin-type processing-associated H-X9-DG protein
MTPTPRRAFTLLELLVVMALIAMLIGMLLPAVQKVREAAAKTQSQNNLKQLGLAFHAHEGDHGHYPPGYQSNSGTAAADAGPGWGWSMFLLPYLEQGNIYHQLRRDLPFYDPANVAVVKSAPKVFLCPAAPNTSSTIRVRDASGADLGEYGRSHYVANVGQDEPWGYDPPLNDDGWREKSTGPFFRNSRTKVATVKDGLSSTVFVGEHTTVSDKTWVGVHPAAVCGPINPARHPFTEPDHPCTYVLCHSGPAASEPGVVHPPSFPTCHVCQMYGPWSGSGGNVLFGDGSVRFVPTNINLSTWAALSSMALGDQPGDW